MRAANGSASSTLVRYLLVIGLAALLPACGGGGGGDGGGSGATMTVETDVISGKVIGVGAIAGALVCLDANANGRCDGSEAQARSDAAGAYQLTVPKNTTGPLVAEIIAGSSRDSDQAGVPVDASYPDGVAVEPVQHDDHALSRRSCACRRKRIIRWPRTRSEIRSGLPPKFVINISTAAASGSLTQAAARAVVAALKVKGNALDLSAPGALDQLVAAFPPALTDLPVLRINTKDAAPIVSKEIFVDATYVLTNPMIPDQTTTLNGKIRGRGHSTWGQPKNPYKVQFNNDASFAQIPDVLGMKKQRNWALLADYFDRSLMRNKLVFSLGNSSVFSDGIKWTPSGQHVEVYLNDAYVGVYLLTEDIRIDPARLDIKKMSSSAAVNDVDGGYIVEVDVRLDCFNDGVINLQHRTPKGLPVCEDTPDEGSITQNQLAYIMNLLDSVEQDLFGPKKMDQINPVSFADWYLIQELFRNNDAAFVTSDYMWKDTAAAANPADRLLNMGPLWDFDLSAGNMNLNDNWKTEGCWVSKSLIFPPNWITVDVRQSGLSEPGAVALEAEAAGAREIHQFGHRHLRPPAGAAGAAEFRGLADLRRAALQLLHLLLACGRGRVPEGVPERADGVARHGVRDPGELRRTVQIGARSAPGSSPRRAIRGNCGSGAFLPPVQPSRRKIQQLHLDMRRSQQRARKIVHLRAPPVGQGHEAAARREHRRNRRDDPRAGPAVDGGKRDSRDDDVRRRQAVMRQGIPKLMGAPAMHDQPRVLDPPQHRAKLGIDLHHQQSGVGRDGVENRPGRAAGAGTELDDDAGGSGCRQFDDAALQKSRAGGDGTDLPGPPEKLPEKHDPVVDRIAQSRSRLHWHAPGDCRRRRFYHRHPRQSAPRPPTAQRDSILRRIAPRRWRWNRWQTVASIGFHIQPGRLRLT